MEFISMFSFFIVMRKRGLFIKRKDVIKHPILMAVVYLKTKTQMIE